MFVTEVATNPAWISRERPGLWIPVDYPRPESREGKGQDRKVWDKCSSVNLLLSHGGETDGWILWKRGFEQWSQSITLNWISWCPLLTEPDCMTDKILAPYNFRQYNIHFLSPRIQNSDSRGFTTTIKLIYKPRDIYSSGQKKAKIFYSQCFIQSVVNLYVCMSFQHKRAVLKSWNVW